MQMTSEEILRDFRQAKHKKEQIKILAELNACSVEEIVDILKAQGVDGRSLHCAKIKKNPSPPEINSPDLSQLQQRIERLLFEKQCIDAELETIRDALEKLFNMAKGGK